MNHIRVATWVPAVGVSSALLAVNLPSIIGHTSRSAQDGTWSLVAIAQKVSDIILHDANLLFLLLLFLRYYRLVGHIYAYLFIYKADAIPVKPTYTVRNVHVIIPTIDPKNDAFLRCIRSCLAQRPQWLTIVAANERTTQEAAEVLLPLKKQSLTSIVKVATFNEANKCRQLAYVIGKLAQEPVDHEDIILVFADEHVWWPSARFLVSLLAPFEDRGVGVVGTSKRVQRDRGTSWTDSFLNFLGTTYLERHNFEITAQNAIDGGAFIISGRTCAVRASVATNTEFLDGFENEYFFFNKLGTLKHDNDLFWTRHVIRKGWNIKFQNCEDSQMWTTLTSSNAGGYSKFLLGHLPRWARSQWRSNSTTLFWRRQPWCSHAVYATWFFNFALIWDPLIVYLWSRSSYDVVKAYHIALLIIGSKMVKLTSYFSRNPRDIVFFPPYVLFAYIHSFIKLWTLLTFWDHSWGGGNLEAVNEATAKGPEDPQPPVLLLELFGDSASSGSYHEPCQKLNSLQERSVSFNAHPSGTGSTYTHNDFSKNTSRTSPAAIRTQDTLFTIPEAPISASTRVSTVMSCSPITPSEIIVQSDNRPARPFAQPNTFPAWGSSSPSKGTSVGSTDGTFTRSRPVTSFKQPNTFIAPGSKSTSRDTSIDSTDGSFTRRFGQKPPLSRQPDAFSAPDSNSTSRETSIDSTDNSFTRKYGQKPGLPGQPNVFTPWGTVRASEPNLVPANVRESHYSQANMIRRRSKTQTPERIPPKSVSDTTSEQEPLPATLTVDNTTAIDNIVETFDVGRSESVSSKSSILSILGSLFSREPNTPAQQPQDELNTQLSSPQLPETPIASLELESETAQAHYRSPHPELEYGSVVSSVGSKATSYTELYEDHRQEKLPGATRPRYNTRRSPPVEVRLPTVFKKSRGESISPRGRPATRCSPVADTIVPIVFKDSISPRDIRGRVRASSAKQTFTQFQFGQARETIIHDRTNAPPDAPVFYHDVSKVVIDKQSRTRSGRKYSRKFIRGDDCLRVHGDGSCLVPPRVHTHGQRRCRSPEPNVYRGGRL